MSTTPIEIHLDGRAHRIDMGTTLAELVTRLGHGPQAVGTAVNGMFVGRTEREQRVLAAGDVVALFQPIVGG